MSDHHHHHGEGCCCHHHEEACCHEGVCHHHHAHDLHHHAHDHQQDFAHELIEMADQAWMEVLKEKIKEQIKTTSGSNLDQLAKLVAEANHERWKHKMSLQKDVHTYQEKLAAFFSRD